MSTKNSLKKSEFDREKKKEITDSRVGPLHRALLLLSGQEEKQEVAAQLQEAAPARHV
jgi:hypothetical protein